VGQDRSAAGSTSGSERSFMNGEIAVITGASAGVGRAAARAFAAAGAGWVVLLACDAGRLADTSVEVEHYGAPALAIPTDVAAVEHAAERVERELGPIAVWVNNAMATIFSPIERITPEDPQAVSGAAASAAAAGAAGAAITAGRLAQGRTGTHSASSPAPAGKRSGRVALRATWRSACCRPRQPGGCCGRGRTGRVD
jgi:NAD(P)-dependent dehydrogenase (short-subunit alcohol dehydrogenase family)